MRTLSIKLIYFLLMVGITGCNLPQATSISAVKNMEHMSLRFGKESKLIEFKDKKAVVTVPDSVKLEVELDFELSEKATLFHKNKVLESGDLIEIEEAKPMIFTVVAEDETWSDFELTVLKPSSSDKQIKWVKIYGTLASIEGQNITALLPYGTDISNLKVDYEHTGKTATLESGTELDFTKKQKVTVSAKDGTDLIYELDVEIDKLRRIDYLGIKVDRLDTTFVAQKKLNIFTVYFPESLDLNKEKLVLDFKIPYGYQSNLKAGDVLEYKAGDLHKLIIDITDELSMYYEIQLTNEEEENPSLGKTAEILSINLDFSPEQDVMSGVKRKLSEIPAVINHIEGTIKLAFPATTSDQILGQAIPYTLLLKDRATSDKEEKITISYANATTVTVTSEDRKTVKEYDIIFEKAPEMKNFFESFYLLINGQQYEVQIDRQTIKIQVPYNTILSTVIPVFNVSQGANASIVSGERMLGLQTDNPKELRVVGSNGLQRTYTLIIERNAPEKGYLKNLNVVFPDNSTLSARSIVQDVNSNHIDEIIFYFPQGTDLLNDIFTLEFDLEGDGAELIHAGLKVEPEETQLKLGLGENLFFVRSTDGTLKLTKVHARIVGSDLNRFLQFNALSQFSVSLGVKIYNDRIDIKVPKNTNVTEILISYRVDPFATVNIGEGYVDFIVGQTKEFIVTSQSGIDRVYKVKVLETDEYLKTAIRTTGRLVSFTDEYYEKSSESINNRRVLNYTIEYGDNNFVSKIIQENQETGEKLEWLYVYDIFNRLHQIYSEDSYTFYTYSNDKIASSDTYIDRRVTFTEEYKYDKNGYLNEVVKVPRTSSVRPGRTKYEYINGNLVGFDASSMSQFDDKKNPFLNLFPPGYRQLSNLSQEYRSENNPLSTFDNISQETNEFYSENTYNDDGYLLGITKEKEYCAIPEESLNECTDLNREVRILSYQYEE